MSANNTDPIVFVIERVEKIESRLEKFIEENTKRLDTLIEITRHMSAINERQLRHSDDISEIKARLNHFETATASSQNITHARIDDLIKSYEESKGLMKGIIDTKFEECNVKVSSVKAEFDKWFNRGVGAWVVFTMIISTIQWISNDSADVSRKRIEQLNSTVSEQAAQIKQLETKYIGKN
jgi:hypothetical protein